MGTVRRRLLVAEDDPGFARALCRGLTRDYDILALVSSGESLVESVEILRPDAIVADVGLDGMDGIAATTLIHALLPTLPIVLLTAGDDLELRPRALAAGAIALLHKSRPAELVGKLRHLWIENDSRSR